MTSRLSILCTVRLKPAAMLTAASLLIFAVSAGSAAGHGAEPDSSGEKQVVELSLERAIGLGLENDELLLQAGQGVAGARYGVREAKAGRLPTLTVSGQYARNVRKPVLFLPSDMGDAFGGVTKIELGEDNDFAANAQLSYNLWTAGRLSAGISASGEILEAMRYQEIATAEFVRFQVTRSFFDVLLAMENQRIAEKAMDATTEVLRVTRAGFEEGTVSRFDLLRAEVEYENRKPQLLASRNGVEQAMIALRRRCGLEPGTTLVLTDSLQSVAEPEDLQYHISLMKTGNSQIRALEHNVSAMQQSLRFERAERWPVLQLGANYLLQGQWSEEFMPEKKNLARSAAVTLGFQIPIFDGLKAKARINRARSDLRTAELELERVCREKEMTVRASWLMLEDAIASLEGRKQAVDLAEEAHRLALVRLKNGLATPVERLDAELAMTTARAQMAQALYACNIARAQLELAVGIDSEGRSFTSYLKEKNDEQ